MKQKIQISGTGCALADFLYNNIDFSSPEFQKYTGNSDGDGGLSPGKLVLTEELEKFANKSYAEIIGDITGNKTPDSFNIGGPSLVSLIHVAQILNDNDFEVKFYGVSGNDDTSKKIRKLLNNTPIGFKGYLPQSKKATPFTHVLSDPGFDNGHGERTFINNMGAAWDLTPEFLPESFFNSDVICFGGTAITPNLHDNLHHLLKKAKSNGAITFVNTVYDFRNEKSNPKNPWPLGNSELSFPNIDILITDKEEAIRISGCSNIRDAVDFFVKKISAFIITRGSEPVLYHSNGNLFEKNAGELPVSKEVSQKIKTREYKGDTTGCGDNYAGGVIVSVAGQLKNNRKKLDLKEAVITGICSGGFTCSYTGGTYFEKEPGEKQQKINTLINAYKNQ